ncbi:MAG: 4a-hydroxytetrahydrobiopterin dehydratase [Acidimicrobiia bacterium]
MEQLTDDEVRDALALLPGWERIGAQIEKTYERESFPEAIVFVTRIGFLAEAANHHPDVDIRWSRVRVALTTHDAGGLTAQDTTFAAALEGVA